MLRGLVLLCCFLMLPRRNKKAPLSRVINVVREVIRAVAENAGVEPALGVDDGAPQTMEREVFDVLLPINHIAAPFFENIVVFVIVAGGRASALPGPSRLGLPPSKASSFHLERRTAVRR